MKYGENFEYESVPEWSLHNIDYNSLKYQIKVHTTRDQATALTIPGHVDTGLAKFEDALYFELCRQHDRVGLFVTSKADEIQRRLQHLSDQVNRLLLRVTTRREGRLSARKQQRFLRYEREIQRCGDDIQALGRFITAQTIAFRKILKKYRKWTGSSSLGGRFKDTVLSNPKSFTRKDLSHLEKAYEELLATIRAATPATESKSESPVSEEQEPDKQRTDDAPESPTLVRDFAPGAINTTDKNAEHYWNEYDDGSEADDYNANGRYVIYVDGEDKSRGFPGMATLVTLFHVPVEKLRGWLGSEKGKGRDVAPLLTNGLGGGYGATNGRRSPTSPGDSSDNEGGYASSEEFPVGYSGYYAALPSINDQRAIRQRERMLLYGTGGSFLLSFVLLGVSFILITVGRHKLRVEVDAGVTVGVVVSLGLACVGLVMALSRHDTIGLASSVALWTAFGGLCIMNGMILVLVAGNTAAP